MSMYNMSTGISSPEEQKEIIDAVESTEYPFATISDVANQVGYSTEWARQRLNGLVEKGVLEREKIAAAAVIYWSDSDS